MTKSSNAFGFAGFGFRTRERGKRGELGSWSKKAKCRCREEGGGSRALYRT